MQHRTQSLVTLAAMMLVIIPMTSSASSKSEQDFYSRQNAAFRQQGLLIDPETLLEELLGAKRKVKTTSDDIRFEVNIPARQLTIYENGREARRYPVTVGRQIYKTPIGPRKLSEMIWNPWWYPPDSRWAKDAEDTPPGPRNPLGKVKIPLGGAIMIHGTNNPKSIGRTASHGCMRMYNHDIIEIANWLLEKFSDRAADPRIAKHRDNWFRHSLYVPLNRTIAFEIVYQTVEVSGDTLIIYPDVYNKNHDSWSELAHALAKVGIPLSDIDLDHLPPGLDVKQTTTFPLLKLFASRTTVVASS